MTWLEKILHPISFSKSIIINGKTLCIEWTDRADSVLRERKHPLNIEMELYFSCMVKKIVIFHESHKSKLDQNKLYSITDQIKVWFHPVISHACDIGDATHQQPTMDVDVKNLHNYYPKKLKIDFRDNRWEGRFS